MRVLIIEDDASLSATMQLVMKGEGFITEHADLGEDGFELAKLYEYDAITLDMSLPDMHGLDVLRDLRTIGNTTPIIVVSGDSSIDTKLKAFAKGADDYLTKPYNIDELIARIGAVVRRSKGHVSPVITCGPISVDTRGKTVRVDGKLVHLTGKEFQMMELLALRKEAVLSKEQFLDNLYGGMDEPEIKIIDVFVCKLRTKLSIAGAVGYIHTVWGRGYKLSETVSNKIVGAGHGRSPTGNKRQPLGTMQGRIAMNLREGEKATRIIAAELGVERVTLGAPLSLMSQSGMVSVRRVSTPGSNWKTGIYSLTAVGEEWLLHRGAPPKVVKPEGEEAA